jgi:hypothetical protein
MGATNDDTRKPLDKHLYDYELASGLAKPLVEILPDIKDAEIRSSLDRSLAQFKEWGARAVYARVTLAFAVADTLKAQMLFIETPEGREEKERFLKTFSEKTGSNIDSDSVGRVVAISAAL